MTGAPDLRAPDLRAPDRRALEAALRSLFPGEVAVAAEPIGAGCLSDLWPEERAAVSGAVPARLAEFCAGRTAARSALAKLDLSPQALPMGPDRAPIWPTGIAGSIAHAARMAIAVAGPVRALGVDIEEDGPLDPELWPVICSTRELDRLPVQGRGQHVRRVFAAKEAVFKAQPQGQRVLFGFEMVDVTLVGDTFATQFLGDIGIFRTGHVQEGRLAQVRGMLLAGVVL